MDCVLDKLVEESEKLLMEVQDDNDLPHITRNLVQIQHMGERLCPSRGSGTEVKAARLLGPKMSYELPQKLTCKLEALVPANVYETVSRIPESDIQSFLKSERENVLLSALLMTRKSMFEEVEERCEAYLQSWWEQVANGVLSSLSGSIAHADTEFICTPDLENYNQPNLLDQRKTLNLTHDELIYANQLDYYLSLHLTTSTDFTSFQNGVPRDLLTCLSMYHDSLSREKQIKLRLKTYQSDVTEMWCLVKRIAHCMRNEYGNMLSCDRPLETRASLSVQNSLSLCSLEHLEFEFLEFVKLTVAEQPRLAQLGGRPGTRSLIRAYLSLRLSSKNLSNDSHQSSGQKDWEFDDGLVDGMPVWPMLFYCLRAGDKRVALEIALEALNNLGNFVSVLEDYVNNNRRLRTPNQARFRQISKQVVKSTRDPYKRLVYSILGNCDLSDNHSDVVSNIDDFLWIKISQVIAQDPEESTVTSRSNADDTLTLGQLQTLLYETYGEAHFDAWSQPFVYFKILFLTQQYEAAIGFLSRFEQFRCHAVHIALALKDLHMLLIPNSIQSSLVSCDDCDPKGLRRLNLVRLIMLYTRKFEVTEPEKALMYYYMLTDIPNTAEKSLEEESNTSIISGLHNMSFDRVTLRSQNLFVRCVCELALATKELDLILGSVGENNTRKVSLESLRLIFISY
ncbi:unnamed protein product [Trichobilharzia szidati]|nr:unnamed protein product [Trichobilharzia szidati]